MAQYIRKLREGMKLDMLIILIRSVILYVIAVCAMRFMGKKQIGQLQPSELVIAIMISEVASIPMQNTGLPLLSGIIPILTLMALEVITGFIGLKSRRFRRILTGYPSLLINKGRIEEKELEKLRLNVDDLLEELRLKSYSDISQVEYAVLETGGGISILPKTEARGVTVKDMGLNLPHMNMSYTVISDGHIDIEELNLANKNFDWLAKELQAREIKSPKEVFLAVIGSNGKLFLQKKDGC